MSLWTQFWSIVQFIPVARLALYGVLALFAGLAFGVLAAWLLHRAGLLRRQTRVGHWAARLYLLYLPAVLALFAMQAALVLCVENTLTDHLQAARPAIRSFTQQALGTARPQLQALLDQNPQLSTVSIERVVDAAIDGAAQTPGALTDGALRKLAAAGAVVLGAHALHETIKDVLAHQLQKLAHIDAQTTRIALSQSLATLADGEFVVRVLAQRMHVFFVSLYRGVGLHCLFWLALAAVEISLARWRWRKTSISRELPAQQH